MATPMLTSNIKNLCMSMLLCDILYPFSVVTDVIALIFCKDIIITLYSHINDLNIRNFTLAIGRTLLFYIDLFFLLLPHEKIKRPKRNAGASPGCQLINFILPFTEAIKLDRLPSSLVEAQLFLDMRQSTEKRRHSE